MEFLRPSLMTMVPTLVTSSVGAGCEILGKVTWHPSYDRSFGVVVLLAAATRGASTELSRVALGYTGLQGPQVEAIGIYIWLYFPPGKWRVEYNPL